MVLNPDVAFFVLNITYSLSGVAVFDHSYFGKFFLEGPEAAKAADWLATAKMEDRPINNTEVYVQFRTISTRNRLKHYIRQNPYTKKL